MLHLDGDFKQICQERKERCEWECCGEESNEAQLDDSFVVVEDKRGRRWLHHHLLTDNRMHFEMGNLKLILVYRRRLKLAHE